MQVQCATRPGLFLLCVFLSRYLYYFFLCVDQRPGEPDPFSMVRPGVLKASFWKKPNTVKVFVVFSCPVGKERALRTENCAISGWFYAFHAVICWCIETWMTQKLVKVPYMTPFINMGEKFHLLLASWCFILLEVSVTLCQEGLNNTDITPRKSPPHRYISSSLNCDGSTFWWFFFLYTKFWQVEHRDLNPWFTHFKWKHIVFTFLFVKSCAKHFQTDNRFHRNDRNAESNVVAGTSK